ncbi:MAG: hypothetical protein R3277_04280 [Brumimicrobium sp.]|nr:hypothetical protein [Brumimicrobium sp.]
MRIVDEIPHSRFKIQIFSFNAKYIVKIELGQFEQSFKISETDVMGLDEIKNMISQEFLSNCLERFISMREDWENSFKQKNINQEE